MESSFRKDQISLFKQFIYHILFSSYIFRCCISDIDATLSIVIYEGPQATESLQPT